MFIFNFVVLFVLFLFANGVKKKKDYWEVQILTYFTNSGLIPRSLVCGLNLMYVGKHPVSSPLSLPSLGWPLSSPTQFETSLAPLHETAPLAIGELPFSRGFTSGLPVPSRWPEIQPAGLRSNPVPARDSFDSLVKTVTFKSEVRFEVDAFSCHQYLLLSVLASSFPTLISPLHSSS